MLRRVSNIAINLGFALLICLPLVRFSAASWTDPLEKRVSAPLPDRPTSLATLKKFPAAFEAYYNDHFGLRGFLIGLRNQIDYSVFKRSPTPRVLLGKHDWLFYTGDKSIEDYRGRQVLTEAELDSWYGALKERRDWLAAQGITYHFVIAPNKQSIYPEYMPAAVVRGAPGLLDQLLGYLSRKGEASLVDDLRPALLAQKSGLSLYRPIDAHWTDYGAYLGYRTIAERIDAVRPGDLRILDLPQTSFAPDVMTFGDLADMMRFHPYPVPVPTSRYAGPALPCDVHDAADEPALRWTEAARTQPDQASECSVPGPATHAVVFHDSMMQAMRSYVASSFSHVRFVSMAPSFSDIKLYVGAEHPEMIIEERVERTLINVPRPENVVTATLSSTPPPLDRGGWLDIGEAGSGSMIINGWAYWQPKGDSRKIVVNTNLPVDGMTVTGAARPDVVEATQDSRLAQSGFQLRLHVDPARPAPETIRLCVWTEDPVYGRRRLNYSNHREWDSCPTI